MANAKIIEQKALVVDEIKGKFDKHWCTRG